MVNLAVSCAASEQAMWAPDSALIMRQLVGCNLLSEGQPGSLSRRALATQLCQAQEEHGACLLE